MMRLPFLQQITSKYRDENGRQADSFVAHSAKSDLGPRAPGIAGSQDTAVCCAATALGSSACALTGTLASSGSACAARNTKFAH